MMLSGVSHFLRMFAARAIPPHTACFGADPKAIKSLLRGACTALRAPRCDGLRLRCRLKVFHWGKEGAAHDPAMSERCLTRYKDYADEYVDADGTRRSWRVAVDGMVTSGPRFGFIYHPGTGTAATIRGDLAVLAPMLDDRTIIMMPYLYGREPASQTVAYQMAREQGWELIELLGGKLFILQWKRACHAQPVSDVRPAGAGDGPAESSAHVAEPVNNPTGESHADANADE